MLSLTYLISVVVSLACMVVIDARWRLFFWADARRAGVVLAAGFAFFLAWDLAAIELQLYERGGSRFMTGLEVAPELPVEELFFVAFLPYLTMVLHGLAVRRLAIQRAERRERVGTR